MSIERLHAVVRGMVQGVGFRYFVIQRARGAGLAGYVENCSDGSVEVIAEGPREELERLLTTLRRGPRYGIVKDVATDWLEATGEFSRFDVRF